MLVNFYRVEYPKYNRAGPYSAWNYIEDKEESIRMEELTYRMATDHTDDPLRPRPEEDGLGYHAHRLTFGFLYIEDLYRWFDGWLDRLLVEGFIIASYAIPYEKIRCGHSGQCAILNIDFKSMQPKGGGSE